jgi:hypothetical protein
MTKPNHVTPSTMLQLVFLKLKLPYFSITTIGNRTNTSQNTLLLINLEVLQIYIDNIALSNKSLVDSVPSIRLSCENVCKLGFKQQQSNSTRTSAFNSINNETNDTFACPKAKLPQTFVNGCDLTAPKTANSKLLDFQILWPQLRNS